MSPPEPTLRHRTEYAAFRLFRLVLGLLPEPAALALGGAAGCLAGRVLRIRRDVVDANLARAFPDRPEAWRRQVAVDAYRHLGHEAVTAFLMGRLSPEAIRSRTRMEGFEALERAAARGRGVVLVTGHLGNWEVGGASVAARGLPVDAVAFRQRNRLFDRDLVRNRARLGMTVITRGRAPREILRSLREGRVAGLVADQNAGRSGIFVDYFGVPASTARGPAVFALRAGAPLFVGAALREPGRRARYRCVVEEVPYEATGDGEEDVRRLTAAHTAALERWVREAPEQYFWQHKRWKTRPPAEAAPAARAGPGAGATPAG